ncbi:MAG: nucleotidyltransferase domain-containing protein [Planctomycetes bacterium]|nr:nucleotidyltransferase domain-containing protein [Planctomycetota bacterium]
MSESCLSAEALDRMRAALATGGSVRLAMLFGSAATGTLRAGSDVDIGVLPLGADLTLRQELDLQVALSRACGREVDLVRLDRAPTLVRWEVARQGVLLWASTPHEAPRFVAEAASEYLDFAPAFERAAETFRRRLAAGPAVR